MGIPLNPANEAIDYGEMHESAGDLVAFNYARMSDVGDEPHDRSLPLTGGIFGVMVEAYQKKLVQSRPTDPRRALRDQELDAIHADFARAYKGNESDFKKALLEARDYLGQLLARTWGELSPDFLTYHDVLRGLLRADRILRGGRQQTIRECFAWREISPLPDSMLLRPRTLRECALGPDRFAALGDSSLEASIRSRSAALQARRGRNKRPYAKR